MTRVDLYDTNYEDENKTPLEEVVLSRVIRNQNMYDEMYINKSLVDINKIDITALDETPKEEPEISNSDINIDSYEKKSYSINDYLSKAHEKISPDDAKRNINNTEFKEQEDEIRKLIDSINEKEESDDFFKDLKGDNEDTMIGAKFKTDEFNDSIYETLKSEKMLDGNTILQHALSDNTVLNLEKEEDSKIDHTFEKIIREENLSRKKSKKLPIIIFSITLFILIVVIAIILLFH